MHNLNKVNLYLYVIVRWFAFEKTLKPWIPSTTFDFVNDRPFPSSLVPLFQNESKCETFHMKMIEFFMQFHFGANQSHFHKNGSHLESVWNRGRLLKSAVIIQAILLQIKSLFRPLVIQLVWCVLKQLFTSVSVKVVDIYLHFGENNC